MRINPITCRKMPKFSAELDFNDEKTKQIYDAAMERIKKEKAGLEKPKEIDLPKDMIEFFIDIYPKKEKIRFGVFTYQEDGFFSSKKKYYCAYDDNGKILFIPYDVAGYDYNLRKSLTASKMSERTFLSHFAHWAADCKMCRTDEEAVKITSGFYPRYQQYSLNIGNYDEMSKPKSGFIYS